MAALIDNSVKVSSAAGVLSLTSAPWTIGGSNRCLYTSVASGGSAPVAPTSAKWQGVSGTVMVLQGIDVTVGAFWSHSLFRLIAPAAVNDTSYTNWPSSRDEVLMISVSTKDTDQTTPNGTIATATGNSFAATVNATTVSGDLTLDFVFNGNDIDVCTIVAAGGQTSLQEIEGADPGFEAMGSSNKTAAGASTTMAWTVTGGTAAENHWSMFAFSINFSPGVATGFFHKSQVCWIDN